MTKHTRLQVASFLGVKIFEARRSDFRKLSVKSSINILDASDDEMENAIDSAIKNNFECIINYCLESKKFLILVPQYSGKE